MQRYFHKGGSREGLRQAELVFPSHSPEAEKASHKKGLFGFIDASPRSNTTSF